MCEFNFDQESKQIEDATSVVKAIMMCGYTPSVRILNSSYPALMFEVFGSIKKIPRPNSEFKLKFVAEKVVITGKESRVSTTIEKEIYVCKII